MLQLLLLALFRYRPFFECKFEARVRKRQSQRSTPPKMTNQLQAEIGREKLVLENWLLKL